MRRGVVTLVAALAAVPVGCGGDDGPTKAEFVERAGAICAGNKERATRALEREFGARPTTPADGPRVLRLALPFIRDSGAEIAKLEPPEGDEERIEAYLAAYRTATAELEAIAKDPRLARALMTGTLEDPFARADGMAGEYGIEKCSGDDA